MKKGYLFIIKNHEDESQTECMKVLNYEDCGVYYWIKFKNGFGSISKDRVVSIEKIIY